jgi:hypothetical protein
MAPLLRLLPRLASTSQARLLLRQPSRRLISNHSSYPSLRKHSHEGFEDRAPLFWIAFAASALVGVAVYTGVREPGIGSEWALWDPADEVYSFTRSLKLSTPLSRGGIKSCGRTRVRGRRHRRLEGLLRAERLRSYADHESKKKKFLYFGGKERRDSALLFFTAYVNESVVLQKQLIGIGS